MESFFAPPEAIRGDLCVIEGDEFSHLATVLRRGPGDRLRIVDGAGMAYDAVIDAVEKRRACCRIERRHPHLHEPRLRVTLASALLKNHSRFDTLVEKGTELGVIRVVPLITARTIPRHGRSDRWRNIALAAMKQAGRCVLPEVTEPVPFADHIQSLPAGTAGFIPHERTEGGIFRGVGPEIGPEVRVCIGPEGGFTEEEVAAAVAAGYHPVSLGPRRLRAETAAIMTAGLLLFEP